MQDKRSKSILGLRDRNKNPELGVGYTIPVTSIPTSGRYSATLKNLKQKQENPFWMPSHNSEIFEVRDILRQERELRKAINRKKQKKKQDLNNIHKDTLRDSYNENISNLYLTEARGGQNLNDFLEKYGKFKTIADGPSYNYNTDHQTQISGTKILKNIEEEKAKEIQKSASETKNDLIQKKIDAIGGKSKESVRDYINKTRELILMKYSIDIKKERVVRLHETYNNEIESIKDSIFSMEEARKMFENEFYLKFEKYVKFLIKQKEKEKSEESNLLESKMKLDSEKSKLSNKISKLEKEKKNYEDCLYFMIRVKEKMLVIPEYYKLDMQSSPSKISKEEIEDRKSTLLNQSDGMNIKNQKRNTKFVSNMVKEEKEKIDRIKGYFNGNTIFDSPKELFDEIKKMEADNIKKLEEFNKINYYLNEVEQELSKMQEDDKKANENSTLDIETKERSLKELKDIHKKLNEERNTLLTENRDGSSVKNKISNRFNSSSMKNKYLEPQLFAKILEVFKSCNEFSVNSSEILDSVKKKSFEVEYNMLIMLKSIEKILDHLNNKYSEYSRSIGVDSQLKFIENKLDHDRKQKKNSDLKIQNQIDEVRKRKEMEERNNRVVVIPKRKFPEKCPPRNKEDRERNNDKNLNNELNFEDFIYY